MNVYTVFGITGEYCNRIDWPVVSYLDEEKAKEHVVLASERARKWGVARDEEFTAPPNGWNAYDPKMMMEYTGTSYYYVTSEIADYTGKQED